MKIVVIEERGLEIHMYTFCSNAGRNDGSSDKHCVVISTQTFPGFWFSIKYPDVRNFVVSTESKSKKKKNKQTNINKITDVGTVGTKALYVVTKQIATL